MNIPAGMFTELRPVARSNGLLLHGVSSIRKTVWRQPSALCSSAFLPSFHFHFMGASGKLGNCHETFSLHMYFKRND
jgi:hypothetical protein